MFFSIRLRRGAALSETRLSHFTPVLGPKWLELLLLSLLPLLLTCFLLRTRQERSPTEKPGSRFAL